MDQDKVYLFEDQPIRSAWVEDEEEWYFSVVDVVGVLTEQLDYQKSRKYWNKLKQRLSEEGSQLVTNCHQLKMIAQDGRKRANMNKITTLESALKRIAELEKENADLKEEIAYLRKRKASGRQRHNAKWMAIYNDFVICYEKGMTMVEIARRNGISERSIYRYKAYYEEMKKNG